MTAEMANIRENPFGNSTDPRLAYFDTPRRNAVARLLTGLYQGEGLFLLIGEDGIGKSTLLCHLGAQVAALAGVRLLHPDPLFRCTEGAGLADLVSGFVAPFAAAGGDPLHLARLLQDLASEGEHMPAMLIDDADRLDDAGLKAIATLATLRGGERRLLSAVLVGTPEVAQRLATMAGVGNRLTATQVIRLMPMSHAEAERMIRHRLRQAGRGDLEEALAPEISELAGQCNGIPLQVMGLCRRALHISEAPVAPLSLPAPAEGPDKSIADAVAPAVVLAGSGTDAPFAAADRRFAAADAHGDSAATSRASGWSEFGPAANKVPDAIPGLADAAGAPLGLTRAGASHTEASGHIRYTAASARRVEPAQWQNARRRRRPGWRMALLSATALIAFGVGWTLYDRSRIDTAEPPAVPDAVTDPASLTALPPSLVPSLVPPLDSGTRPGVPPVLPGASPAETWWRPPAATEGSGKGGNEPHATPDAGESRPAPVVSSSGQRGSDEAAGEAPKPSAAVSAPPMHSSAPVAQAPEPVAQTPAPAIPPRPVAKSSPPAATSQPAGGNARPARDAVVEVLPVEVPPTSTRSAETRSSSRGRQKEALLMDGDERLLAGEVEAARAIYQEAFDHGSAEAARRLAQTFDPRNVAATSRDASAAEAILWYKDAARRGDRRARGELEGLETWLEDAAASGNAEAQRVLQVWRAPVATDTATEDTHEEP